MHLMKPDHRLISSDFELIGTHIPTHGAALIELGCGAAVTTRKIAESFPVDHILALEVDEIQHARNLLIDDLPSVRFELGGMQSIPAADESADAVIMLKSLHHVPGSHLRKGFAEVHRVLKPGGKLYISEPVFAGELNEIIRLFHDEEVVREQAFAAIRHVVVSGLFELEHEIHFLSETRFPGGFEDFDRHILQATHSTFDIDEALFAKIKKSFEAHLAADGSASFQSPMRVDILVK